VGSLTNCIKQAGGFLHPEDKAALLERVRALRNGDMSPAESARQAVQEQLDHVGGLLERGEFPAAKTEAGGSPTDPNTARVQQIATESPDMPVKLPGSEKTTTVSEALKQVEAEHAHDMTMGDLVKAALDCALGR
jgi:hypothetical protein